MAKSIREIATPAQRKALIKINHPDKLPDEIKAIVYGGNRGGAGAAMQFHTDLRVYGLWEALLYVENYEKAPYRYYESCTAITAFRRIVATLQPARIELPPHTDEWMQGDRYATVETTTHPSTLIVILDKSRRRISIKLDDAKVIEYKPYVKRIDEEEQDEPNPTAQPWSSGL